MAMTNQATKIVMINLFFGACFIASNKAIMLHECTNEKNETNLMMMMMMMMMKNETKLKHFFERHIIMA
jgi:hypothetical protein